MSQQINKDEIHRLADDIRVIKGFTENNGFDSTLINVNISPKKDKKGKVVDYCLICFLLSCLVFVVSVSVNVYMDITVKQSELLMVVSLLFVGFTTMSAHLKFKNNGATTIITIFMLAVFLIGFGIFTPKEVVEKAEQYIPKT
ncbi:hypothetical protein [Photobacterium sanguinicancri]|uniref:hypothetical protein n=1 Tax=Photobacterium sanguinicancri TaxID=875932 RepID=UPI000787E54A|nr:hypothetical protein [Photobacterium sanguinicancri]KXI23678.1 hypothetical protein AS132_06165 [Photobacterium sanguinicancri]